MENYKNLIWWLRWMGTGQTGEATYTRAADAFENLMTENAALQEAYDAMSRDLAARTEQVRRLQEEKAKLCYGQEVGKNA